MISVYFFFNDTATTEIYTYRHTLSLHDALPILLFERGTFGRHGTENKAAVTRYARQFCKADTGFRNAFVAIGQRIAHQVAGIRESTGMVWEDQRFAIALLRGAKFVAPGRDIVRKKRGKIERASSRERVCK